MGVRLRTMPSPNCLRIQVTTMLHRVECSEWIVSFNYFLLSISRAAMYSCHFMLVAPSILSRCNLDRCIRRQILSLLHRTIPSAPSCLLIHQYAEWPLYDRPHVPSAIRQCRYF